AFQTLLGRYSGQSDIAVGTPIANRSHSEIEGVIGLFLNTLVIRTDLSANPSFQQLLQQVRETCLAAYAHQDLPFERLVEALQPERDLSRPPLFQVMFVLQPRIEAQQMAGVWLRLPEEEETTTAKFDLILNVQEVPAGLLCSVEYNVDLFEASTMARLLEHWQGLLQAMVTHPEQGIWDVSLLTEAERQQVLGQWNATARQEPACPLLIHEGIEQQVQRTPETLALVAEQGALTYDELNRRANQLAHYLRQRGVGPGSLVGLCLERSLEMVIGLLAILKAGGAYLPLDPDYPSQRLNFMVKDAQIAVLLTKKRFYPLFSSDRTRITCIDAEWEMIGQRPTANLLSEVNGKHLVYIIYTSGSTGQPKGAGASHQGKINLLHWFIDECAITAQDRFLLVSSLGFDLSQKDIFAPLSVGATLSLLPSGAYDPAMIVQTIAQQQITFLNCTPSAFYPLLEQATGDAALGSLRLLFLGGEPISLARLHAWMTSPSFHTQIINGYGPTECTDTALFYRLPPPEQAAETIPLGKPLRNV